MRVRARYGSQRPVRGISNAGLKYVFSRAARTWMIDAVSTLLQSNMPLTVPVAKAIVRLSLNLFLCFKIIGSVDSASRQRAHSHVKS